MSNFLKFSIFICSLTSTLFMFGQTDEIPKYKPINADLHAQIVKMDSTFFNAYNKCDMKTQTKIYNDNIEFFHDKNGLSTSKKDLLIATEKYICNKVNRILVKGSIEVYPINNYGAVQIGYHKFHNKVENVISAPSKFVIIWKKTQQDWTITKVISLH